MSRPVGVWLAAASAVLAPVLTTVAAAGTPAAAGPSYQRSCAAPSPGYAACDALVRTDGHGGNGKGHGGGGGGGTTNPAGYHPADLQSAYALASAAASAGGTQTVALVDAYDDPNAANDLGVYRSTFNLPACTTANGCFRKVNENGGTSYPTANGGWAQEISLDLDMVSAICPNCHILLVEASSATIADLGTAVNEAALLGATEISNSYGGAESSADTSYDTAYFDHPGIAVTAAAGDGGYGVEYPAASPYVTAVGGTTLTPDSSVARGWTESAWSGTGSGCSAVEPQPSWQSSLSNITSTCPANRAVADVSADANPNTGVSVYDSYAYHGQKGWLVFGGTSVATPIIASVYALAGNASTASGANLPYADAVSSGSSPTINDVTTGSNGSCGTDLCNAGPGWDGPTGLGTPDGTGAF